MSDIMDNLSEIKEINRLDNGNLKHYIHPKIVKRYFHSVRNGDYNCDFFIGGDTQYGINDLSGAIHNGNLDLVFKILPTVINDDTEVNESLYASCGYGYVDIVKVLVTLPNVLPNYVFYKPLNIACRNGYTEVVELLLSREIKEDISSKMIRDDLNKAFNIACEYGHIDIVKLFLKYPCLQPEYNGNNSILMATTKGYVEIVSSLLQCEGISPQFNDNLILVNAIIYGYNDIVKLLLQDPRVTENPISLQRTINKAFRFALSKGKINSELYSFTIEFLLFKIRSQYMDDCIISFIPNDIINEIIIKIFSL